MNSAVIHTIQAFQRELPFAGGDVLDVGSMNINCRWSGRDLWQSDLCVAAGNWDYTGLDIEHGPNVDLVVPEGPFDLKRKFQVVMSCGCLEHTRRPWLMFRCMTEHLTPGGWLYALVPWVCPYHPFPIDGWRISPDGWRVLCLDNSVELVKTYLYASGLRKELTWVGVALNLWMRWRYGCRPKESIVVARKPRPC